MGTAVPFLIQKFKNQEENLPRFPVVLRVEYQSSSTGETIKDSDTTVMEAIQNPKIRK